MGFRYRDLRNEQSNMMIYIPRMMQTDLAEIHFAAGGE